MIKKCNKCLFEKHVDLYPKRKDSNDGYRNTCKSCTNLGGKVRYQRDDVKLKEKKKSQKWYKANKELVKIKTKEYKRISRRNLKVKLKDNLRTRLNSAIKNNYKTGSAVKDLGCSVEELKKYLESKFQEGMTWTNWSRTGWHIDHIEPLASFNLSNREELKKACHYTNLQPLWAEDNWAKGCK